MKSRFIYTAFVLSLTAAATMWSCRSDSPAQQMEEIDAEALFVYEIHPLIESKCLSCHGEKPEEIEGELQRGSLRPIKWTGVRVNPLGMRFSLTSRQSINYMVHAVKTSA